MPYCAVSDVQALNPARQVGTGTGQPSVAQVQVYINMTAAEIDAILVTKGYTVPVSSGYTEAYALLNAANARGAVAMMERGAPTSPNLDRFERGWEDTKTFLRDSQFTMDAPKDEQRASPRGPGVTTAPGVVSGQTLDPNYPFQGVQSVPPSLQNTGGVPFFSRGMQF